MSLHTNIGYVSVQVKCYLLLGKSGTVGLLKFVTGDDNGERRMVRLLLDILCVWTLFLWLWFVCPYGARNRKRF